MTSCSSLKRKTVRTVIFWGLIYFMGIPAFSQTQLTPKLGMRITGTKIPDTIEPYSSRMPGRHI